MTNEHRPTTARNAEQQAELEQQITQLFEHKIVFNEFLGFKCVFIASDKVGVKFDMRPELVGHFVFGRLHGGVIASVLDVAGGLAVMWGIAEQYSTETANEIMQRFRPLATIDMRVDYLRQGIGEHFIAESTVTRLGKRIATTSSVLSNEAGTTIATASAAYILI